MTNDLISRKALQEKFADMRDGYPIFSDSEMVSTKIIAQIIDDAPTVELDGYVLYGTGLELVSTDWLDEQLGKDRPQRGEWVFIPDENRHMCNQCKEYAPSFKNGEENLSHYCSNCGAKMSNA